MRTITQAIIDLKDNLKDSMKITMEEFNDTLCEVYDGLSSQVIALEERAKDKKDQSIAVLQDQYNSLKQLMDDYKKLSTDKVSTYRQDIVHKLGELNEKIDEYNRKHKS